MSRTVSVAARLAELVEARANCEKSGNAEWHAHHSGEIMRIARDELPHGAGIDSGCVVRTEECSPVKLVIHVPFHCMDENGCYDGWRDYTIVATPRFGSVEIAVRGRDYNGLKDYLADLFHETLTRQLTIG